MQFLPFTEAMNTYAASVGCQLKDIRFTFDGEILNGSLTPKELEIEDGYCIDVVRLKK